MSIDSVGLKSICEAITEQTIDGITVADNNGNYTFVNQAFCTMMGYSEEELLCMTVFDVKAPDQDCSSFELTKTVHEGKPFEVLLKRKDGSVFISEVVGKNIQVNGSPQILGIVRDITEQVRAREHINTLSLAVEQSPVSVAIVDLKGQVQYANSTTHRKTKYSVDELAGMQFAQLFSSDNDTAFSTIWNRLENGHSWEGELKCLKKNETTFWEYAHFSPVKDVYGKTIQYLAVKEDISSRKKQEEQIIKQAHFDSLTELPNRHLSLDRLNHAILEAKRNNGKVALLFIDLDDFKDVNDSHGHESGDKVLVQVAQRLLRGVREEDTIGRLGGDEFIAVLSRVKSDDDPKLVSDNLIQCLQDPFYLNGKEINIGVSIGIAIYLDDGNSASELLRNADSAMYSAKSNGRNNQAFFEVS